MRDIQIGVIGAGTIGEGVAQNFAQYGIPTILIDIVQDKLEAAKQNIIQNLRLYKLYHKNADIKTEQEPLQYLTFTKDYEALAKVDFIVENVTEKWGVKKDVYEKIDCICPSHTIFAVNTSCISITSIASVTNRPTQVIGAHFMNPVPLKNVVEMIRGYQTSKETIDFTKEILKSLEKEVIVINDMPGFVSNRLMTFMINEAAYLVQEQVASVKDIDAIIKMSYGHKMGPLETADLIGIDTILYSMEVLYDSFKDSKYRPCPLLKKMVDSGKLGCKSGRGFFQYTKF